MIYHYVLAIKKLAKKKLAIINYSNIKYGPISLPSHEKIRKLNNTYVNKKRYLCSKECNFWLINLYVI